ncbi:cohesin subunit SA-2 isoform X2 [Drosophila kikkawai]|uniref:Cohesin subunit SA-2 isoform X2 n=1 Tax=Drosophila kikkawai TaxID=30033 RepID=A0ABM4GG99_DROKI
MDFDEIQVAEQSSNGENSVELIQSAEPIKEQPKKGEKSLLQSVLDNNLKHEDVSNQWLQLYVKNPNAALVEILQLVVEASGSHYEIPKSTTRPFVYRDILEASTEQFRSVSNYYPLIMKDTAQDFEHRVGDFVQCLLKLVHVTPLISDQVFLSEVTGFVMACSESNMRPIRHTSTMIGLKMMTALNDFPPVANKDAPLKRLWLRMFDCLFVARHLDVVTGIRLLCITELNLWMIKYPKGNLQSKNLRYFYEGLRDNFGIVRKFCLESLIDLTCCKLELREISLELAIEYRDLILLTCVERESELGESALNLLSNLYQYSSTILSNVDCRLLDQLMFAANRGLALAAAGLFKLRWLNPQRGASSSQIIHRLLDFFVRYVKHEHAAYLVDSLIDICELILDWEIMVDMLMKDQEESGLSPGETSTLIEILCRGVKQAITGEIPPGRYTKDLVRLPLPESQLRATQILAPILSQLLSKHLSSSHDLENLLELPQHFHLNYYRQEENIDQLDLLIRQIKAIMYKQDRSLVLRMGALTLVHLKGIPLVKSHLQELLNTAVFNYKMALRTWQQMYGTPSLSSPRASSRSSSPGHNHPRSRTRSLLGSLRLISALYRYFDLSNFHLTSSVLSSLKRVFKDYDQRPSRDRDDLPAEATTQYLEVCFYSLNWDLRSVKREDDNRSDLELEESCAALKKHLEDYLTVALDLVAKGNPMLDHDSFGTICDLYVVFADPLLQNPRSFVRSLRYEPAVKEFDLLETFVLNYLFAGRQPQDLVKESHFDELQQKRYILTGYCKLVAFNVIPSMRSCKVLQYYDKYHAAFGDIMRASMERAMDINPVNYGMTMLHTCLLPFERIMTDVKHDGVRAMSTMEFRQLLNLAHRLGEIFYMDLLKNRHSVNALHRAGILYVVESTYDDAQTAAPKNLPFLDVLKEFVPHLLNQDRVNVAKFLQRIEMPSLPSVNREEWQPLEDYRGALVTKN